jgi:hypothetical protein
MWLAGFAPSAALYLIDAGFVIRLRTVRQAADTPRADLAASGRH